MISFDKKISIVPRAVLQVVSNVFLEKLTDEGHFIIITIHSSNDIIKITNQHWDTSYFPKKIT